MAKYEVTKDFTDLQDDRYIYREGDKFPRKGRAKKARIEELIGKKNSRGEAVIQEVKSDEPDENEEEEEEEEETTDE